MIGDDDVVAFRGPRLVLELRDRGSLFERKFVFKNSISVMDFFKCNYLFLLFRHFLNKQNPCYDNIDLQ